MVHLALRVGSNLVELAARNKAFACARVVNRLEILRERLQQLLAKFAAKAYVFRLVRPMEGHIKPFHGEARGGLLRLGLILGGALLDKFLNVGTKPTVA